MVLKRVEWKYILKHSYVLLPYRRVKKQSWLEYIFCGKTYFSRGVYSLEETRFFLVPTLRKSFHSNPSFCQENEES